MGERPKNPNTEIYAPYLFTPLLKKAVLADSYNYKNNLNGNIESKNEVLNSVWGENTENKVRFSPSTASNCLRWVGYESLGYKPAPNTFESQVGLMIGSSAHYSISRVLKGYGLSEQSLFDEERNISGRYDFLFKNPQTQDWQMIDFKFVSDYGFRQIKREGLSETLKNTKNIYNSTPEAKRQLITYMSIARNQGFNVMMGNVVYINRNDGKIKESLIPWDALTEHEADQFFAQIKEAGEKIGKGELPEPSVQSKYVCGSFCPYRGYCEYGQNFAADKVKRESKRRAPLWVIKKAREEAAEKKLKMEESGIVQPDLFSIVKEGKETGTIYQNPNPAEK